MPERQDLLTAIDTIGTCEDEAERRNMLDALRDNINTVFDENETLTQNNENLTTANETLRNCNTDLFLQLGEQKSKKETKKTETGLDSDPEPRKFENLFNDKGEFK